MSTYHTALVSWLFPIKYIKISNPHNLLSLAYPVFNLPRKKYFLRGVGLASDWLPLVTSLAVLVRNSSDTRTLLESNECHHSLPSNVGSVRTWQGCEYSYASYFVVPLNSLYSSI